VSGLSFSPSQAISEFNRYNIISCSDRSIINIPFLFLFDRLQVIGDPMVGWSNGRGSASNGKERYRGSGSSNGEVFKRVAPDSDDIIDEL
jgi:hypothetical protein